MKKFSKIIALAMAAVLTFSISPAINAEAKTLSKRVVYMSTTSGATSSFSISVDGVKKITNAKSDNSKIKPSYYDLSTRTQLEGDKKTTYSASVGVTAYKPGTATITFKGDNTNYTQKVEVKKYSNPLSSLKVNGKDITSYFNKGTSAYSKYVDSASTMKVEAKSKGDWVIESIGISNSLDNGYHRVYHSYYNNVKKGSLTFSKFNAKKYGTISVDLRNKKDGGYLYLYVSARPASSK